MQINNIVDNTFGLYKLDKSARHHSIKKQVADAASKVVTDILINKRASTQPQSVLSHGRNKENKMNGSGEKRR